jgi:hypothetical protein
MAQAVMMMALPFWTTYISWSGHLMLLHLIHSQFHPANVPDGSHTVQQVQQQVALLYMLVTWKCSQ